MNEKLAKEALERTLLLMKYDTSKTLTENTVLVENKELLLEVEPISMTAILIWSLVAAGTSTVIYGWASWTNAGEAPDNFEKALKACSSLKPAQTQTEDEIEGIVDDLYNSIEGWGTKLTELMIPALKRIQTPGDLCAVNKRYQEKVTRDLFDDIDGDVDGNDWVKVWMAIEPMLTKTKKVAQKMIADLKTFSFNCLKKSELEGGTRNLTYDKDMVPYLRLVSETGKQYLIDSDGVVYNTKFQNLGYTLQCQNNTAVMVKEGRDISDKKKILEFKDPVKTGGGGGGSSNKTIIALQQNLVNKGYNIGNTGPKGDGVDGIYGIKTKGAETAMKNGIDAKTYNSKLTQTPEKPTLIPVTKLPDTETHTTLDITPKNGETQSYSTTEPSTSSKTQQVSPANVQSGTPQRGRVIKTTHPNDW